MKDSVAVFPVAHLGRQFLGEEGDVGTSQREPMNVRRLAGADHAPHVFLDCAIPSSRKKHDGCEPLAKNVGGGHGRAPMNGGRRNVGFVVDVTFDPTAGG